MRMSGGATERMIRSIHKVLLAAVGTQLLTDGQLQLCAKLNVL